MCVPPRAYVCLFGASLSGANYSNMDRLFKSVLRLTCTRYAMLFSFKMPHFHRVLCQCCAPRLPELLLPSILTKLCVLALKFGWLRMYHKLLYSFKTV